MKKLFPFICLVFVALLSNCTLKEIINPDGSIKTSKVQGTSGGVTGYTGSAGDTYQPVTTGSAWTYTYQIPGSQPFTVTSSITGATATFNGKTYYAANSDSPLAGKSVGYYLPGPHLYKIRGTTIIHGVTIDMLYLSDTTDVGHSITTPVNDAGEINGIPGRFVTTIKEKGISKTINNHTFNEVIHTQVDLQYDYGFGYESSGTYDYYLAKGIGLIETDTNIFGTDLGSETLTGYSIK